jgi:hypothetical protein
LVVASVLAARGDKQTAFAMQAVPAVLTLALLAAARQQYPRPRDLEPKLQDVQTLLTRGYHFEVTNTVQSDLCDYANAMAVGIGGSLVSGRMCDPSAIDRFEAPRPAEVVRLDRCVEERLLIMWCACSRRMRRPG